MTDVPENRVPFPKPAATTRQYELLLPQLRGGRPALPDEADLMPNRKTDTNNNVAFSTDYIGMNYDYPDANYDAGGRDHRGARPYQQGLMWTWPTTRGPARRSATRWARGAWPRTSSPTTATGRTSSTSARPGGMVGDYVMTEHNCRGTRADAGLGRHGLVQHGLAQRPALRRRGRPRPQRGRRPGQPGGPYPISYRSIVPKAGECTNLLVPVCLASSHIAYGSIRMEPVFMILGQSAATAAALAIDAGVPVQDVDHAKLRERLLADRQVLEL